MTPATMTDCELIRASALLREEVDATWTRGEIQASDFLFQRHMAIIREMNRRVDALERVR
jgi:hypothetical protein